MLGVWLSTNVLSCLMRTTCSSRRLMNSFSVGNFVLPLSTLAFSTLAFLYWRHVNFTILNDLLHCIVVGFIERGGLVLFCVFSVYNGWLEMIIPSSCCLNFCVLCGENETLTLSKCACCPCPAAIQWDIQYHDAWHSNEEGEQRWGRPRFHYKSLQWLAWSTYVSSTCKRLKTERSFSPATGLSDGCILLL